MTNSNVKAVKLNNHIKWNQAAITSSEEGAER